jgi:hypothetical protein
MSLPLVSPGVSLKRSLFWRPVSQTNTKASNRQLCVQSRRNYIAYKCVTGLWHGSIHRHSFAVVWHRHTESVSFNYRKNLKNYRKIGANKKIDFRFIYKFSKKTFYFEKNLGSLLPVTLSRKYVLRRTWITSSKEQIIIIITIIITVIVIIIIIQLTYSVERSTSWESNRFSASQEIPRSLPHLQVPATCPILSQLDPVHALTSHFLQIHSNIIRSSTAEFI